MLRKMIVGMLLLGLVIADVPRR